MPTIATYGHKFCMEVKHNTTQKEIGIAGEGCGRKHDQGIFALPIKVDYRIATR